MLNRDERRRLHEIERWFEENEPRFAESVRRPPPDAGTLRRRRAAIAVAVLGCLVLFAGLVIVSPVVVFLGISLGVGALAVRYLLLSGRG